MNGYREMFRGVVYPWHCDHLGHMTVQHYVGMFDQAAWHLLSAIGMGWEAMKAAGTSLVDAKHSIEYRHEQKVGSLIVVESALVRVGTKSITQRHRMLNTETGVLAATSEIVSVNFDLETRRSLEIPEAQREAFRQFLVDAE
jgi:acyl-CoA thioester hydrolase